MQIFKNESYENFIHSIKSKNTKIIYQKCMRYFLEFSGCKNYDELVTISNRDKLIQKFLISLKEKNLSRDYVNLNLSAIASFYMMNDISINRRKLNKFLPESIKKVKDRAYTREEISLLLKNSDLRFQTIIYILASTGIRIGALPELKLKHVEKIDNNIYQFTIYENTKEEYITFCTPECAQSIDMYLEYRQRYGENLNKESPLIREQFDITAPVSQINRSKHISISTFQNNFQAIARRTGLRTIDKVHCRKEVKLMHGFRKFFNTTLIENGMNFQTKELLMGHKQNLGLDFNYYRPQIQKLKDEYLKAANDLTINEENRLKQENKILLQENKKNDFIIADIYEKMNKMYEISKYGFDYNFQENEKFQKTS